MTWVHRHARILLALYSIFLAVALFSPTSSAQSAAVLWLQGHLGLLPAGWGTYERLEVLMNAAIVAPVPVLGGLVWPSLSWRDWTALAFLAAVCVETVQALLLPGRQATFSDVVANTAGALAGAVLIAVIRPMLRTQVQTRTQT